MPSSSSQLTAEAEHHGVLSSDAVAQVSTEKHARKCERGQEEFPFRRRFNAAIRHDAVDDETGEDAVRERDEVVKKPSAASSDETPPVISNDKSIGHPSLDRAATIELRVEHFQPEVEHLKPHQSNRKQLLEIPRPAQLTVNGNRTPMPKVTLHTVDK